MKNCSKKASFDLPKYEDIAQGMVMNYHLYPVTFEPKLTMGGQSELRQFPAMDMSFEAAQLYCEWLTSQYNVQKDRKFNKVKFRLPSEKEWTMAALGYRDFQSWNFEENIVLAHPDHKEKKAMEYQLERGDCKYPWAIKSWAHRNNIKNWHQCVFANVKMPDEVTCPAGILGDGFRITSTVGTYFPNDNGLFDVIGNVSEMINEEGKAMGGSWDHTPEESTLLSVNMYEGTSTAVGFRVFMEVIDE